MLKCTICFRCLPRHDDIHEEFSVKDDEHRSDSFLRTSTPDLKITNIEHLLSFLVETLKSESAAAAAAAAEM